MSADGEFQVFRCLTDKDGRLVPVTVPLYEVFVAIAKERAFQDAKYGPVLLSDMDAYYKNGVGVSQQGPGGHELGTWSIIAEKELDEVKDALIHGGSTKTLGRNSARSEFVQVAAVCCAALEQHGVTE